MYELIIIAIYSVLILAFVPLGKIAKAQDWVKAKIKNIKNKID
jgi:competence protein ComGC